MLIWQYEVRRIGWPVLFLPLLTVMGIGFLTLLTWALGRFADVNRVLSETLDVVPLATGLGAAGVLRRDHSLELQLSLPCPFRLTVARRLGMFLTVAALVALVATSVLQADSRLTWPVASVAANLIWLPPLLWLSGVGSLSSLWGGTAAGAAACATIWTAETLLGSVFANTPGLRLVWLFMRYSAAQSSTWYVNRAFLLVSSAVLLGVTFWKLGHGERLLDREA